MKKVLVALCFMLGFAGLASAQVVNKKSPGVSKIEKVKKGPGMTVAADGPKKADGTLDKRFKANKGSKKTEAAVPLKKDGTPDKRFKANKVKKG